MESKEFIKKFSTITVRKVCKKLNIKNSNVSSGRTSKKNYDLIKDEIKKELSILYEGDSDV